MYEELVKALLEHANKMCVTFKGAHACGSNLAYEAADAIEELADRNVGKWIPATERLPECYKWVLGITDENELPIEVFYDGFRWQDCILNVEHVTHWMPLPEPPKEET